MAIKMASKGSKQEEEGELALTLEEHESCALEEIEHMELEWHVRQLEDKRDSEYDGRKLPLEIRIQRGRHTRRPLIDAMFLKRRHWQQVQWEMVIPLMVALAVGLEGGHVSGTVVPVHAVEAHPTDGWGKWSLRKNTSGQKKLHSLNRYEFILATTKWAFDIDSMTVAEHRALLELNIYYI